MTGSAKTETTPLAKPVLYAGRRDDEETHCLDVGPTGDACFARRMFLAGILGAGRGQRSPRLARRPALGPDEVVPNNRTVG